MLQQETVNTWKKKTLNRSSQQRNTINKSQMVILELKNTINWNFKKYRISMS